MKQRLFISLILLVFSVTGIESLKAQQNTNKENEVIFIWGGDINVKFVEYIAGLTGKENPEICYLPTASADNQDNINYWGAICNILKIDTIILKVWVSSSEKNQSFEDILLNSDAIVVGGGNTLNMLGIWKAQGIDVMLKKALKKGIVVAGGSAGSICWFQNGISDSRPLALSIVDGLGILPYSNCPHYSQENRRELYHRMIMERKIPFGYATDELAGILFKNGKATEFVSQSNEHNSYFVSIEKGKIKSQKVESNILLRKNALPESSYSSLPVEKKINDLLDINDRLSPLNAYIVEMKASQQNNPNLNNIGIQKIYQYNNKLAGIVNDAYLNSWGYGLWYFYNCNGIWASMGEDIGGATVSDSEIVFREKAEIIIKRAEETLDCH
jgi:peptidase E